jgi:hypothetical protein
VQQFQPQQQGLMNLYQTFDAMAVFNTNKQPGFHILISLIEVWKPQDKKKPNGDVQGSVMRICEVEHVEIEESYKKLIGTASVRFPRGTILRKTIEGRTDEQQKDFESVTVTLSNSGVVEENRSSETSTVTTSTFSVGQRIKIYLGYTTDPKVAAMAKTNNTGQKTIYNDEETRKSYQSNFKHKKADGKEYMSLMFDGYITKVSLDTPIELECENLASYLKTITCPKVKLKKCEVKDFIGEDGRYKLLQDTGLILHPDTAKMDFDLGAVELSTDLTVADVLTEWAKYGLFCYVGDYNGQPAIQIGRAYFSNPGNDSLLKAKTTPTPTPIHFDYHVASNGLSLTSSDKDFLAVQAKGIDADDKFINITIIKNPQYDSSKEESSSNPAYRYVNETKLSKKALKAGKRYLTDAPNDKVDMKLYTQIAFVSKTRPITTEKLAEEAIKYYEGYNMTGIEGSITLFGDLHLRTADQVELIDTRYPGKNGIYLVEEVNTTFGVDGFRQKITLPYCISRAGNKTSN